MTAAPIFRNNANVREFAMVRWDPVPEAGARRKKTDRGAANDREHPARAMAVMGNVGNFCVDGSRCRSGSLSMEAALCFFTGCRSVDRSAG
jgi:hypothetical protein